MAQEFVARKGLLVPSGNVGIGTTSPAELLHLQSSQPVIRYTKTGVLNWKAGVITGNDYAITADNIATTALTIQSSTGNVGIGTTSPTSAKLQVKGDNGTAIGYFFNNTGTAGQVLGLAVEAGTNSSDYALSIASSLGTPYLRVRGDGNVGIGTTFFPNSVYKFVVNQGTDRTFAIAQQDNELSIEAYNTAGSLSVPLRFYASKFSFNNGNVGIGTTSPSERLEVSNTYRDNTSGLFTAVVSSTTSQATGYGGSIGFQGVYTGTSLTSFGSIMGAKENSIDGNTAGYLALFTRTNAGANTERMRINSAGNVLINITSTIDSKLVVASSTSTSASYSAIFASSSGSDILDIRGDGLITMPFLISVFTTGNAANVWTNPSNGDLYRSTSSIKYKKNVENYTKGLTELMQLRPVSYEGKSEVDEGKTFAGLIAEEVHELGLTEYVQYSDDGSPNALSYQNMVAILIKSVQELKNELETLKNK